MIGDRIKELRKDNQITQSDLAKIIDVSPSTIGMYEQNRRYPDNQVIVKLADYFTVSSDYLLGRTDVKDPNIEKELPEEFTTPEEAIDFLLNQNVIMGYGGFDIDELDDDEKIEFANELLNQLQLLSYKYKK